jgi:superfamily I DNA/RNA helicase
VQDLNLLGVQLLHALVGDRPDGLLLIGDGQQAVYPGGFSLSEAGINVAGRSNVLRVNYRNTAEILDLAWQVVAEESFDDLDGAPVAGARDVQVTRTGGVTLRVDQPDPGLHDDALVTAVRQHHAELGVRLGDMAVLCSANWQAARYLRVLQAQGIGCMPLDQYDGQTTERVKVGTFHRAKGLEFANVYLPGLSSRPIDRLSEEPDSTYRERIELFHRQLFVGMTRARDLLWLGYRD